MGFVQKRGYAEAEIEAYFAKYDKDGNRALNEEEMKTMRDDLKNQYNKIDNDMNEIKKDEDKNEEE